MSLQAIAARLEQLEAADASPNELLAALAGVEESGMLWRVADRVVPYLTIMSAIHARALAIGASVETARGYLALGHLFEGDLETAAVITQSAGEASHDAVLLDAWVLSAADSVDTMERLRKALERCPDSLRLWRQRANQAVRLNDRRAAAEAYRWLAAHETDPTESQRIAEMIRSNGW